MELKGLKILIVDDEEDIIDLTGTSLETEGAEVLSALNGREGLTLYLQNKDVNAIVTDMKMPEMDGAEMIQAIRESCQAVPIIAVTGYSEYSEEHIKKIGGSDFFFKPLPMTDLIQKIKELTIKDQL